MAPDTNSNPELFQLLQNLPASARPKAERLLRNYRFVAPLTKEDKTNAQARYGDISYRVAYTLPKETADELAKSANPKCYKCLGSGVTDWRVQGTKARVCRCVSTHTRTTSVEK